MKNIKKKITNRCEDCTHCETDPETGELICNQNLDEDELERFSVGRTEACARYNSRVRPERLAGVPFDEISSGETD